MGLESKNNPDCNVIISDGGGKSQSVGYRASFDTLHSSSKGIVHTFGTKELLADALLKSISRSFDAHFAVKLASEATDGEFYIYGGTLRRILLGDKREGDLDFVVNQGDNRIYDAYERLGLSFVRNSNNHHRYRWNKRQIDICSPGEFFGGHSSLDEMLRSVDLKINSLALHVGSWTILDPYGIISDRVPDIGINWSLWDSATGDKLVLLAIRLIRVMHEYPYCDISATDCQKLRDVVLPEIEKNTWTRLTDRFPAGKDVFVNLFKETIARRSRDLRAMGVESRR